MFILSHEIQSDFMPVRMHVLFFLPACCDLVDEIEFSCNLRRIYRQRVGFLKDSAVCHERTCLLLLHLFSQRKK